MNQEILHKAIAKWGRKMQIHKIQEELLELALVINKMDCPTKDKKKMEENLYEELGDVKIMMAQAEILFDKKRIDKRVDSKLQLMDEKYFSTTFKVLVCMHCNSEMITPGDGGFWCDDCRKLTPKRLTA